MAASLKSFFSPALVRRLAGDLTRVSPTFPGDTFVRQACAGLARLELLARGKHIADALARSLPPAYPDAVAVLLRSLGPVHATDELLGVGMAPFFYLPHVLFVAKHGLQHFDLSMRAQYELTQRFTCEASIRPYIAQDPERTFAMLHTWANDSKAHVRRLVSEGTRLRLPWATRVPWLDAHPERVIALLELLKDDPSTVVRRSVANNLNDLGKVRPELLMLTASSWLRDASPARRALVEHALRSAIKRGDRDALGLLGFGKKALVAVDEVRIVPARVIIGDRAKMTFVLRSTAARPQDLLIDTAVHFVKAAGHTAPKVFKLKRVVLGPRQQVALRATFSLAVHTTRVPRPGRHAVDIIVNGHHHAAGAFHVIAGKPASTASRA